MTRSTGYLFTMILLFCYNSLFAQSKIQSVQDSVDYHKDEGFSFTDSLVQKLNLESEHAIDSITNLHPTDSIKKIENEITNKLHDLSFPSKLKNWIDSIGRKHNYSRKFWLQFDSLKSKTNNKNLKKVFSEAETIMRDYQDDLDKLNQIKDLQVRVQDEYLSKIPKVDDFNSPINEIKPLQKLNTEYVDIKNDVSENEYTRQLKNIDAQLEKASSIDKEIEQKALNMEEIRELKKESESIDLLKEESISEKSKIEEKTEEYTDPSFLQRQAAQKAFRVANDVASEQMAKIKSTMDQMQEMKKKYWTVDNSKDVEEGDEKPSKGRPINKKLRLGGALQMNPGDPLSLDISPNLIYRFNDYLLFSLGGSWRYALDPKDDYRPPEKKDMVYGFRMFSQYKIYKSFFIHVEWERLTKPPQEELDERNWDDGLLLGLGRYFSFGKLRGNMTLAYDFYDENSNIFRERLRMKLGFWVK